MKKTSTASWTLTVLLCFTVISCNSGNNSSSTTSDSVLSNSKEQKKEAKPPSEESIQTVNQITTVLPDREIDVPGAGKLNLKKLALDCVDRYKKSSANGTFPTAIKTLSVSFEKDRLQEWMQSIKADNIDCEFAIYTPAFVDAINALSKANILDDLKHPFPRMGDVKNRITIMFFPYNTTGTNSNPSTSSFSAYNIGNVRP